MFRAVTVLAALVLLATCPASAGTMIFDFTLGEDGGFSAATPIAPAWTFSGTDWRVNGVNSASRVLLSPTLTASGGPVTVTFVHATSFENTWDGGILAYQIQGLAASQVVNFTQGGYTHPSIVASFPTGGTGRPGFSGTFSTTSIGNIPGMTAGTIFVLRFEAAWDAIILAANPNWRISSVIVDGVTAADTGIPEPGTALLILAGGFALLAWRSYSRR